MDLVLPGLGAAQARAILIALSKLHKFLNRADNSEGRYKSNKFRHLFSHGH